MFDLVCKRGFVSARQTTTFVACKRAHKAECRPPELLAAAVLHLSSRGVLLDEALAQIGLRRALLGADGGMKNCRPKIFFLILDSGIDGQLFFFC